MVRSLEVRPASSESIFVQGGKNQMNGNNYNKVIRRFRGWKKNIYIYTHLDFPFLKMYERLEDPKM